MKLMKKILIGIVVIAAIIVGVYFYATGSAEKLTEYELGGDKVASINAVIGETRKVTGVDVGTSVTTSGSAQHKQYNYETESMVQDLTTYSLYLQNNGWMVTQGYNLSVGKGEMQFGIESEESGKILIMAIAFDQGMYAIRITKTEGTLTRNQP